MGRVLRILLALVGIGTGLYGVKLLLDLGRENLVATLTWLVGGVVLHDGVLGPVSILAAAVALGISRGRVPAAVAVGAIVLGSVTLVGVPVLGRFGARTDNPTLLDRSYGAGWLAVAGLTLLVVGASWWRTRPKTEGGVDGTGPGSR